MHPYPRTLINLFAGDVRYVIPIYQRKYAWKEDHQWKLLWEDIIGATEKIKNDRSVNFKHFMGALVLYKLPTYGEQVNAFEVIDGQQRLTTIQLIIAAFRDATLGVSPNHSKQAERYLLNSGLMDNEEIERYKLWPTITDRATFVSIVDGDADIEGPHFASSDFPDNAKQSHKGYLYFLSKIKNYIDGDTIETPKRSSLLFEAMKDRLAVVSIELDQSDDPQTIFETLNSRGEHLTEGDLVRNYIFQRALRENVEEPNKVDKLYRKYWLPLDGDIWSSTRSQGKLTLPQRDWMLTDHLSMIKAQNVSPSRFFSTYRNWILNKQPFQNLEEELVSIEQSANVYQEIRSQNPHSPLGKFGIMTEAFDTNTAVPLAMYLALNSENDEELARGLKHIESFIIRRDVCRQTTKNYNNFFVELIDDLKKSDNRTDEALHDLLCEGEAETNWWPRDDNFKEDWITGKQYRYGRSKRLVYILSQIEKAKRSDKDEDIEIKSSLTVEHVMPRKWQKYCFPTQEEIEGFDKSDQFGEDFEARRNDYVDRMGNLTLLTQKLNSSVSNENFAVKRPEIIKQSSLTLNREFQDQKSWSSEATNIWNEKQINARSEELFSWALKIW